MAEVPLSNRCVAEFIGTYMLVFTVGCNVLGGTAVWGGVSIACVLMVCIYALGGISGANFNPAVSFALGLNKNFGGNGMPWKDVGVYCFVQIVAGIAAAFTYSTLFVDSFTLMPSKGLGPLSVALCEFFYTFMLVYVVLNVAAAKKYDAPNGNQWFGLAIGFVIVAGAYGAGAVSGGCFNPAVAIAIDVSSFEKGFGWCGLFMLAELAGGAIAVGAFMLTRPEDFGWSLCEEGDRTVLIRIPQIVSEFIGTFMLVLTVGLNVLGKSPAGAFSIAASLMCMIYAVGDVSGGNFNPAVTAAILMYGRETSFTMAGLYIVTQVIAGILAAFCYSFIYHGTTFELGPQGKNGWGAVALAETLFTFVLCFSVLSVAVSKKTCSKDMFGLIIGSCVTVGGFAVGGISGASLNPAVSYGIAAVHMLNKGSLASAYIYGGFEMMGSVIATGMMMLTHGLELDAADSETGKELATDDKDVKA